MRVHTTGVRPVHQAPVTGWPAAEVLVDERAGAGQLAAAHLATPPGGRMPDESTALVVPLAGELLMAAGSTRRG